MAIKRIDDILNGGNVVTDRPAPDFDWPAWCRRDVSIFPALQDWFDRHPGETLTFPHPYECRFEGRLRFDGIIDLNGSAVIIDPTKMLDVEGTGAGKSGFMNGVIEMSPPLFVYHGCGDISLYAIGGAAKP